MDDATRPAPPLPAPLPAPLIEAFGGGGFRVDGVRHAGAILILEGDARPWPATALPRLAPADLRPVLDTPAGTVEILLLGTGPAAAPAPKTVREALRIAGVGLDVMSTPEACRLFNYLTGEGRRVAAALLAV